MKSLIVSVVLLLSICTPRTSQAVDLTAWDLGLSAWAEVAVSLDMSSSIWMTSHYNHYQETNPVYGKYPSQSLYYQVWGGMTALNLVLLMSPAPHWLKDTFFFGEGAVETGVVANNLSLGLHFAF